jgi:hypothetical protein
VFHVEHSRVRPNAAPNFLRTPYSGQEITSMKVEECSTWNMLGWSLRWQSTPANVGFRTAGSDEINYGIPTKRRVALTSGPRELPST